MKLDQIIFGTTRFKVGNRWYVIDFINPSGIHFVGGTWCSIFIDKGVLKDGLDYRILPDSDFDDYFGQKVNLLELT